MGLALFQAIGCSSAPPPETRGVAAENGTSGSSSGSGSGGSAGSGIPTSGRGGTIGTGGSIGVGGSAGAISPTGGTGTDCAATTTAAKLLPLDLYVVTDSSKSMLQTTLAGSSKWDALKNAMSAFFGDPGGEGLSVAIKYFPDVEAGVPAACTDDAACGTFGPCDQRKACVTAGTFSTAISQVCSSDTECATGEICVPVQECPDGPNCSKVRCVSGGEGTPCPAECKPFDNYCRLREVCAGEHYATPDVPMTGLPAGVQALTDSLNARTPDGYTPTGPTLTGAIQFAQMHQTANPTHKVAIVLVTDGLPGGFIPGMPPPACIPSDVAGVSTLVQTGAMGTPPIPTFVIGVFGPCDLVDENTRPQQNLDTWAVSGGTTKSILISTDKDVAQELKNALNQIRTAAIACRYATPDVPAAQVDFLKVNVTFAAGAAMPTTLNYVTNAAGCDPTSGGWYYDADPKTGGVPKEIITCDVSCSQFQAVPDGHVDIAYGCPTVEPH